MVTQHNSVLAKALWIQGLAAHQRAKTRGERTMAKYYLDTQAKDDLSGYHVHADDCSHMPAKESRYYIGSYSNPQAAVDDVKMYFKPVTCCPDCAAS